MKRRIRLGHVGLLATVMTAGLVLLIVTRTLRVPDAPTVQPPSVVEAPVNLDHAARHLGEAIRIPVLTQDGEPTDTAALARLHAWLAQTYPDIHRAAPPDAVGGGTLIYRLPGKGGGGQPIVLMAHQDVVPVQNPDRWKVPPSSGELRDGAIWGRGAIDDRGSLIAILEVLDLLARRGTIPNRDIYLVAGHDEEGGGAGARAAAEWFRQREVRPEFVLDEGSAVISDHPVTNGPVALIGLSEKGYATLQVTASAPGGHSSAPPTETAVTILAEALRRIGNHPSPLQYSGPTEQMLESLAPHVPFTTRMAIANSWLFAPLLKHEIGATPQGAAMLHTTIAPTMLRGSPKANILATEASAWLNYRIAPGDTTADVMQRTRAAVSGLSVSLSFEPSVQEPSPVSSATSPGFRLIARAAERTFGVIAAPAPVIAATDSRVFNGIAENVYRFQPIEISLAGTEMIHGTDEHLTIENLRKMLSFYYDLLSTAAGAG